MKTRNSLIRSKLILPTALMAVLTLTAINASAEDEMMGTMPPPQQNDPSSTQSDPSDTADANQDHAKMVEDHKKMIKDHKKMAEMGSKKSMSGKPQMKKKMGKMKNMPMMEDDQMKPPPMQDKPVEPMDGGHM